MPSGGRVIVTVASNVNPAISTTATVTLLNPHPTVASVSPSHIPLGPYTLTVNGSAFVQGAQVVIGSTMLPTTFVSATKLTATGTATLSQMGTVMPVTVLNPDPGWSASVSSVSVMFGNTDGTPTISYEAAARFLDQAAWGGDAATIAHVQSIGFANYIQEQLGAAMSPFTDPSDTAYYLGGVQSRFFSNAVHGQDQLRQRVAFALLNIFVVSAVTGQHRAADNSVFADFAKGRVRELPPADGRRDAEPHHGSVPEHGEQRQGEYNNRHRRE